MENCITCVADAHLLYGCCIFSIGPVVSSSHPSLSHGLGTGKSRLASLLNWWLAKSEWSHNQLGAIANWATHERNWLSSPQISHIRNGNVKQVGFQNLLALGAVNGAVYRWKVEGEAEAVRLYGTFSAHGVTEALMAKSIWLPHPVTNEPLVFHDFCDVFVSLLEMPCISEVAISPQEAKTLTEEIAGVMDDLTAQTGLGLRGGMAEILKHYSITDPDRITRLQSVIHGRHLYSKEECEEELASLSQIVAGMRGLPPGTYGAREFYAELTSGRRRT